MNIYAQRFKSVQERFEEKFIPEPNSGCWIWIGGGDRYGNFDVNDTSISAHRFSYELYVGPVPDGLTIDHKCRMTLCVNPDHLEPVTLRENCRRKPEQRNQYQNATHCIHGHPFTPDNTGLTKRKGQRVCLICHRRRCAAYLAKKESRNG